MSNTSSGPAPAQGSAVQPRRNVLVALAAGFVGAVVGIVPLIPGAAFVLDPLLRKRKGGVGGGFVPVTNLDAIPTDGSPRAFPVKMDIQDAWNKFPNREVGSVFLSRNPDGSLKCLSCVCPHLGCTINYLEKSKSFLCPCHASGFKLDGERDNQIPPRGMDPLEVRIVDKNVVEVNYQAFRAGTSERKPVG